MDLDREELIKRARKEISTESPIRLFAYSSSFRPPLLRLFLLPSRLLARYPSSS